MISSIVVGFDGSDASDRALQLACEIGARFGAAVQVSHTPKDETVEYVAEMVSGFYVGPNIAKQEMLREAAERMACRAKDVAAEAGHKMLEVHIGHKDPAEDVLSLSEKVNADLIVTGRRGLGELRGLVMGSTSHAISKHAKCACMTVL